MGMAIALASSFSNKEMSKELMVTGEVGLSGEVRAVTRIESRLKEGINLGFKKCILPKKNLKNLSKNIKDNIELIGVNHISEAIKHILT